MTECGTFRRSLSLPDAEEVTIRCRTSLPAADDWRIRLRRQQCAHS